MNNNDNFNNSQNNNWGTTPDNNPEPNQGNVNNFNQNQSWGSSQQNDNGFNSNQNDFGNNQGINQQNSANTTPDLNQPYDGAYTPNSNLEGGFNPNTDYSNGNTGYNPNQTYNNNFNNIPNNSYNTDPYNSNMNSGYTPVDNNQYNYGNQQMNGTQNMYGNLGEDTGKSKAMTSLIIGIISSLISLVGIIMFWGSMASACDIATGSSSGTDSELVSIGAGIILSGFIPFVSLILGIIGIAVGASYHKKSKTTGVYTNKGKATGGIALSVIGVILSAFSVLACVSCMACGVCASGSEYSYDDYDDYSYYDDYDYDDYDYDFDDDDYL